MTATKYKTVRDLIVAAVDRAGTDTALAKMLGFADGSRVGQWKAGKGRPSELAVGRIARWMNLDPIETLRLAGYEEMADMFEGRVPTWSPEVEHIRIQLKGLKAIIDATLKTLE